MSQEWVSPNGVRHLVTMGQCVTCGRSHDEADNMADEIAQGIIDECEGDLDLAIKVVEKTRYLLGKLNDRQAQMTAFNWTESEITMLYGREAAVRNALKDFAVTRDAYKEFYGTIIGFGDAAGEPPRFGATDYSEDQT